MEPRGGLAPQQVPHTFAALLQGLRDADDPLLNPTLAASRTRGWRTPTLARALGMNPSAVSKRIERARAAARGNAVLAQALALEASLTETARSSSTPPTPAAELEELARRVAELDIPEAPAPVRVRANKDGKQMPAEQIEKLIEMCQIAERVNGATPSDHSSRATSKLFSAELNRLIVKEGYSPNYLATILDRSHRAITSRLERHGFRDPCPSVAGTPSGEYHDRRIGDPGEGVARISPALRDALRRGWVESQQAPDAPLLRVAVEAALAQDFTLAAVAQVLPRHPAVDGRPPRQVGLAELRQRLGAVRPDAAANAG